MNHHQSRPSRKPAFVMATFSLAVLLIVTGCRSSSEIDIGTLAAGSDDKLWEAASEQLEKSRFDNARQYLNRLIEGFPQSPHQAEARLAVADSYFREGTTVSLLMAAAEYRDFAGLYPSHPKAQYAQLQIAESFYRERNPPDRDQTQTELALDEYLRFIQLYPSAPEAAKAQERVQELTDSLARSELAVGYFYQRTRKSYRAAVLRYRDILKGYPKFSQTDEVLLRLAQCLLAAGLPAEAAPQLDRLIREFPESDHLPEATELLEQATAQIPAAAPPAAEAPPKTTEAVADPS